MLAMLSGAINAWAARDAKQQALVFAKFCQAHFGLPMSTMNISLPDRLKSFVDEQVSQRGYGTSSEYVRELIRKDQDRLKLRALLLAGAASPSGAQADATYFEGLRTRIRKRAKSDSRRLNPKRLFLENRPDGMSKR